MNANDPKILSPKTTATALAEVISVCESTVIYAMFMKTYKVVTAGTATTMLLGMFLKVKYANRDF